jgi:hypothetical protein
MGSPFEGLPFTLNKKEIVSYLCKIGFYNSVKDPMFEIRLDRFFWLCYCFAYHMYVNKKDFKKDITQFQLYSKIDKPGNALYLTLPNPNEGYFIKCCQYFLEAPDFQCELTLRPESSPYTKINMNPEIPPDEDWPLFIGYPILEVFFKERFK